MASPKTVLKITIALIVLTFCLMMVYKGLTWNTLIRGYQSNIPAAVSFPHNQSSASSLATLLVNSRTAKDDLVKSLCNTTDVASKSATTRSMVIAFNTVQNVQLNKTSFANIAPAEATNLAAAKILDNRRLLESQLLAGPFNTSYRNPCWYNNSELYCLPYFFVAGFPKCGTTDLFAKLAWHPDISASYIKEIHWWTRTRFNGRCHALVDATLVRGQEFAKVLRVSTKIR